MIAMNDVFGNKSVCMGSKRLMMDDERLMVLTHREGLMTDNKFV